MIKENSATFDYVAKLASLLMDESTPALTLQEKSTNWKGISYHIGDKHFITSMKEVVQVIQIDKFTRIPGVQPWVRGLIQVHGKLLPVYDLHAFFLKSYRHFSSILNVIVIQYDNQWNGMVVDKILGLKSFAPDMRHSNDEKENTVFSPYIEGFYQDGAKQWSILSLIHLAEQSTLLNLKRGAS